MSRVLLEIDHSLPQHELFKFLKDNKKTLMAQKKAVNKICDPVTVMPMYGLKTDDGDIEMKAAGEAAIPDTATSLIVEAAANTSMWCDTGMDVLLRDSGKKSMKERKGMIPHIYDHNWSVLSEVGEVQSIFYQDVPLRELNVKKEGTAQVLTFKTEIIKSYNSAVFDKYRLKKVKQHSIGLRYQELLLAINAPDDDYWEEEYKVWKKYIDQIINKEVPESMGYFWAVPQYMLLENSAVLLGANLLTPTLTTSEKSESTSDTPSNKDTESGPEEIEGFDVLTNIKEIKFF